MASLTFVFKTYIVPKKNSFRSGISKNGRAYQFRSEWAKNSQQDLRWEAKASMHTHRPIDEPVTVLALFRKTRADCIGLLETVLDALEGVVYHNDRQVVDLAAKWDDRGLLKEGESAKVIVETYQPRNL